MTEQEAQQMEEEGLPTSDEIPDELFLDEEDEEADETDDEEEEK
jgi:hypothetical protein